MCLPSLPLLSDLHIKEELEAAADGSASVCSDVSDTSTDNRHTQKARRFSGQFTQREPPRPAVEPCWSPEASAETYGINGWGQDYFSISEAGTLLVAPQGGECGGRGIACARQPVPLTKPRGHAAPEPSLNPLRVTIGRRRERAGAGPAQPDPDAGGAGRSGAAPLPLPPHCGPPHRQAQCECFGELWAAVLVLGRGDSW